MNPSIAIGKARIPVTGTIVLFAVLIAAASTPAGPPLAVAADNPVVYKTLFSTKCSACHNLPDPGVIQNTQERWRAVVAKMAGRAQGNITDEDQAHIVSYLGLFPPKQTSAKPDGLGTAPDDVWDRDPLHSFVSTLATPDQLAQFRSLGGKPSSTPLSPAALTDGIILTAPAVNALLVHRTATLNGGLDLRIKVRFPATANLDRCAGLVFGFVDVLNYDAVLFDASNKRASLVRCQAGQSSTIATAPLADIDDTQSWHTVRLMFRPQSHRATVWVDSSKRLNAELGDYADGGQLGLLATPRTTAGFKDLYADIYGQ
ncbi:MAG: hypothetical protein P4L33_01275 [Capsulimonadaceae bacterium]|nr:hypothetical protein [Capsulimonadaceae bacterium]